MIFETLFPKPVKVKTLNRNDQFTSSEITKLEEEDALEIHQEIVKQERLKSGLTTIVGAVMRKQNCWERSACTVGSYMSAVQAKDVFFM